MKTIYIVGGTMGVGKTTICQVMKQELINSVFLDGDWCWDSNPFQVNDETKKMVLQNICFLINQFIHCSVYENIIFCWVMHEQSIIDEILQNINIINCKVKVISLVCSEKYLCERLMKDVKAGKRTEDIIEKSVARIPYYEKLNTKKIDTDGKTSEKIAKEILEYDL